MFLITCPMMTLNLFINFKGSDLTCDSPPPKYLLISVSLNIEVPKLRILWGSISWLSGNCTDAFWKDLHFKHLCSQAFHSEVWTIFLQFGCPLLSRAGFVHQDPVCFRVLDYSFWIELDIWLEQSQMLT